MKISDVPMPFKEFTKQYSWPGISTLRSYRRKAEEMGIEDAFVEHGWNVFIKPKTFFELAQKNNLKSRGKYNLKRKGNNEHKRN